MGTRAAPLVREALDCALWSTLPEDVLLLILARLPLHTLARLRIVCKKWMELWESQAFWHLRSRGRAEKSWYIFNWKASKDGIADGPSFSYNPSVGKWHSCLFNPMSAAFERVMATAGGLLFCVPRPKVVKLKLGVRGSFVLFWRWHEMVVCNPLKLNCHTYLPLERGHWSPNIVGMVVDSGTNTYKIVLASERKGTEIYDSVTKSWKLINACCPPALPCHTHAIAHKGCICSVGVGKVSVLDVAKEVWTSLGLPRSDKEIVNMQLYDCEGRLLLVGALICDGPREEVIMNVWELVGEFPTRGVWQELSTMPADQIVTNFLPETIEHEAKDDLLFVPGLTLQKNAADTRSEERSQEKAFLYSLSRKSWYFVYKSSNPRFASPQLDCLRFEPRIEACV